jgi:type II secretion system protein D
MASSVLWILPSCGPADAEGSSKAADVPGAAAGPATSTPAGTEAAPKDAASEIVESSGTKPPESAPTGAVPLSGEAAGANGPAARGDGAGPALASTTTPAVPASADGASGPPASTSSAPDASPGAATAANPPPTPAEIQVSFVGADLGALTNWLAQTTGKSVYTHNKVQIRLTVMSPKPLPPREAIRLVYRTLSLEGISAIETDRVIYIVPEGMEPRVDLEVIDAADTSVLEGRQFVIKSFPLRHARAADLRERVKSVLSTGARVDVMEATNRLVVTDSADNVRILAELLADLDQPSRQSLETEIFKLTHVRASFLVPILKSVFASGRTRSASETPSAPSAPSSAATSPGAAAPTPPSAPGGDASVPTSSPPASTPSTDSASAPSLEVIPDEAANRLIITGTKETLVEVREFIERLDVPPDSDIQVRMIELEWVDADELSREIRPMFERLRQGTEKDPIEITANTRRNSLIVLSNETTYENLKELVKSLDTQEAEKKVMRVFTLEHADAQDIAEQLEDLYDTGSSNSYRWYWDDDGRDETVRMKFVPNRRRNEVLAIGPPTGMDAVADLVKRLDEPVDKETLAPRIYRLKFVDALDIELVLNSLFSKEKDRNMPYWYYDDYGYEPEQDRDVGRLFGKVRIVSALDSNAIIVTTNAPENFSAIEKVLEQLDVPAETQTTLSVELKYAKAVAVANNINILFAQSGAPPRQPVQPQQGNQNPQQPQNPNASTPSFQLEEDHDEESYHPWLGGQPEPAVRGQTGRARQASDLVGRVRVVADGRTNSLHVTTNSHFFPQVMRVVDALDIPTPQVLIEAKIVEISTDDRERLGVRFSPDGNRVFDAEDFDDSIIGSATGTYSEIFSGSNLPGALRTGVYSGEINLDVLVQFLRKTTQSRVRAEPRINVADNEIGRLFVGSRIPFITNSQVTDTGARNDAFEYRDVGIILEVVPKINAEGEVSLKIHVESSQIRPGETLFGGAILDTRTYNTDVTIRSDQLLVLGGMLQREESEIVRKVPLLGDIPLLGYLFRKEDTVVREVELMVFLRPMVTRSWADVAKLLESEDRRARLIHGWEREIERRRRESDAEDDERESEEDADDEEERVKPGEGASGAEETRSNRGATEPSARLDGSGSGRRTGEAENASRGSGAENARALPGAAIERTWRAARGEEEEKATSSGRSAGSTPGTGGVSGSGTAAAPRS